MAFIYSDRRNGAPTTVIGGAVGRRGTKASGEKKTVELGRKSRDESRGSEAMFRRGGPLWRPLRFTLHEGVSLRRAFRALAGRKCAPARRSHIRRILNRERGEA